MSSDLELHGNASGYGRVYQQGHGRQYNIDQAVFEDHGAGRAILPMGIGIVSLVRESDPLELGVHRASSLNGNAVPCYVARDVDDEVAEKITSLAGRGGLLVVVGDSTAGKTRTAYQALLRTVPDHRIINPHDRAELLDSLGAIVVSGRSIVLWLDDIERFIGGNGLTGRIVAQLKHMGVLCVGTVRTEHYRRLTNLSTIGSAGGSGRHGELISVEDVFNQADKVFMQRLWTPAESARAANVDDPRIGEALMRKGRYGLSEYLAAGPQLFEEWLIASAVDANPRGAAIVSAAIDCQRAGVYGAIPLEVLQATHEHYLDSAGGELLRPESFELALDWATRRRYGVTSLLLPGREQASFRAFDYLVDRVIANQGVRPVSDVIWTALQSYFSENKNQLYQIAGAALAQGESDIAVPILRSLAGQGFGLAAQQLGRFYLRRNELENAENWLKKAIDLGTVSAAVVLGHVLEESKRVPEAQSWYELAISNDDPHAMYHMGIICRNKGMDKEAEDWFRKAIERKEFNASSGLGELLVSSGRLGEAEALLRAAGDNGDIPAIVYLGVVLANLGRNEEAEEFWLKAAKSGSRTAKNNLALLYEASGRYPEAERLFLEAVSEGADSASLMLSIFLAERGEWSRADTFGRQAFGEGDTCVAVHLGQILFIAKRYKDSEKWYRMALDAEEPGAIAGLAWLLDRVGRPQEAATFWHRLIDEDDVDASFALAQLALAEGNIDEAIMLFRKAAEEDRNATAACELGTIYKKKGEGGKAEEWLQRSLADGHYHAACRLGSLYSDYGNYEDAEKYWTISYRQGHLHAAECLSSMLVSIGRGRDAATWLRRSRKVYDPARAIKKRQRGKGKRR
jgi:uncharacterized protein